MGPCLPHSEDSRNGSCSRYRRHDCGEDWETGDAGVSGAGRAQGAVPALSGWERLRVTISLMRADRPAGRESWARPDPRTLLCRVCGESGRICGGAETRGSLAWVAKKQCCLPRRGCPGGAQETPPGRTLGSQTRTKPNRASCAPALGRRPAAAREANQRHGPLTDPAPGRRRAGGSRPGRRGPHSASRGHPNPQTWRWGLPFTRGALDRARN